MREVAEHSEVERSFRRTPPAAYGGTPLPEGGSYSIPIRNPALHGISFVACTSPPLRGGCRRRRRGELPVTEA